jgi:hypothetical protein
VTTYLFNELYIPIGFAILKSVKSQVRKFYCGKEEALETKHLFEKLHQGTKIWMNVGNTEFTKTFKF